MLLTFCLHLFTCLLPPALGQAFTVRTPLCNATAANDEVAVRKLLKKGEDPKEYCTKFNMECPLDIAATWGYYDIGKMLLEKKANPNSKGGLGYAPSLHAAENVRGRFLHLLLEYGADVNVEILNLNLMSKAAVGYIDGYYFWAKSERIERKKELLRVVDALFEFCFDLDADGQFARTRLSSHGFNEELEYLVNITNKAQPDKCYQHLFRHDQE